MEESVQSLISQLDDILKSGRRIVYTHQGKKTILLDPKLLKPIMTNLISNAIRFSNEGSIIEIKRSYFENVLKVSVADVGIGISFDDQGHLYERFFRGGNVNNIQGIGLGLHIIRNYAELMNGNIRCESEPGKGSTSEVLFNLHPHK